MRRFIFQGKHSYSSFLECLGENKFSLDDLNKTAVLGFLRDGILYHDETFINGLKKDFTHQVLSLDDEKGFVDSPGNIELGSDTIASRNALSAFVSFFERRKELLKDKKISIDLTGGSDSRLLASVLHDLEIPFDAVFSLGAGSDEERKIVKEVAEQLGIRLNLISVNEIESEQELASFFALGDGMWDVLGMRSLHKVQSWRKKEGYELAITGVGGELYKDFWWQQDFPFYRSKKNRLDRLLNIRFNRVSVPAHWLKERMKPLVKVDTEMLLDRMSVLQTNMNTKTYDEIYFHLKIKEQISVLSHAANSIIPTYSPLLESDLLSIGYNLPRSNRFLNRFHREVITRLAPEVSRIRSTDGGMSVSSDLTYLGRDIFKFARTKMSRLLEILGKPDDKNHPDVQGFIGNKIDEGIKLLKEAGIFTHRVPEDYHEMPRILWGRILTLGFVLKKLHQ